MKKKKDLTPFPLKIIRWLYPKVERIIPSLAHRYFIKLFITPMRYAVPEKEKKAMGFANKFSFEVSGNRIQAYSWGEGPTYVLLVHGWAGRSTQFRRFIKPLIKAGYCVVGFDGPAHGNSEGTQTTMLEFEVALKKIYEIKGVPAAIIAHSFGGGVALFAAMNGLPIKKLVNIASPTMGDEIIQTYLNAINGSLATGAYFKRYMVNTYGKTFDDFTALHIIKNLPTPINLLLVHDADDKEVAMYQAEELIKVYPSGKLIRTKGLGHTRILKDNDVIQSIVTFIGEDASVRNNPR